jgi:phenylalanyl-tRNA synthetase beta chain
VRLANPLSADHVMLRSRVLPGLVREVERNWSVHTRDVRLFEIGTVFEPGAPGERPIERQQVAAVVTGAREPAHWTAAGHTPDVDAWDARGVFEAVVALANRGATVHVEGDGWIASREGRVVGRAGQVAADAPPWAGTLFGLEVEIVPRTPPVVSYRPLPVTPAAERDLALLVPDAVPVADVLATAVEAAGPLLERTGVIDEYRGAGVPAGARGVAIRLTLRAPDRTLRDSDIEEAVQRVRATLEGTLGVVLRTA